MIKILIISNVRCKELGSFITQRGAFRVDGCYSSISENVMDIQNKIIEVDKTLYLYQPEESATNIRADMQVLQTMLETNSFFKPGEIIFVTRTTPQCKQAEKYFVTVMNSCGYKDYSVKIIEGAISFSVIYDNLIGLSSSTDFKNTYSTLYRKERNVKSSIAYEKQDDSGLILEPFNFESLENYENQKKLVTDATSSITFKDDTDGKVAGFNRPGFGRLDITDAAGGPPVVMLTGKAKSGLSTWTSALAVSSAKAVHGVLVMDYTSNSDVSKHLVDEKISFTECRMKNILERRDNADGISVCTYHNDAEYLVRLNFLKNIFCSAALKQSIVLIPVDYHDFARTYTMLKGEIAKVIFTVTPRHSDVIELLDFVDLIDCADVLAILNKCVQMKGEEIMSQEQVKEALALFNAKVAKNYHFDSINVGTGLYIAMLQIGGDS